MMRRPSHTGQHGGFDWIVGPNEGDLFIQRAFLRVCQRAATRKRRVSPAEHATSFARTVSEATRRISPSSDPGCWIRLVAKSVEFRRRAGRQVSPDINSLRARYQRDGRGCSRTSVGGMYSQLCPGGCRVVQYGEKHELRVVAIAMAAANSNGREWEAVVGRLSGEMSGFIFGVAPKCPLLSRRAGALGIFVRIPKCESPSASSGQTSSAGYPLDPRIESWLRTESTRSPKPSTSAARARSTPEQNGNSGEK